MSRLERWSRRKRNVQSEEETPPTAVANAAVEETSAAPSALQNEAEQPGQPEGAAGATDAAPVQAPEPGSLDHTLPDPDHLAAGSDFSAFMAPGVSGALRRRALKRLWATGNYNVRDGLDDYDADYHQQLKPMASELASKLRRWTHKVEEAVDKQLDDTQDNPQPEIASQQEAPSSEQINEPASSLTQETTGSETTADNADHKRG
ncbi:hypothetical protein HVA01_02680 [Halovibrio variabilis]|uniref:DUF3306 domain-containing protein n=1 Tax=Halovibrio variabilis TaxID=31910 RepID=A0A511UN93_9GAMM|nr:DUF3306 domain-containing protein [Halovibrio variabilis]GEN26622.1 hypothetical protein HVA01_02680 [Halovibrio variabilis]